jgi:hypothetical protein
MMKIVTSSLESKQVLFYMMGIKTTIPEVSLIFHKIQHILKDVSDRQYNNENITLFKTLKYIKRALSLGPEQEFTLFGILLISCMSASVSVSVQRSSD